MSEAFLFFYHIVFLDLNNNVSLPLIRNAEDDGSDLEEPSVLDQQSHALLAALPGPRTPQYSSRAPELGILLPCVRGIILLRENLSSVVVGRK